jgi:tetratricopeptide (TPR) repeat protein
VLEGSVRKSGNRLRITAQLVEASTGNHLWADKFDGELVDVFDLQDQITAGVVGAIEPSTRGPEIQRSRRKHPESLDAYDLYLRALPHIWAHTPTDSAKAIEFLEAALKIDPSFGPAHGFLARSYQQRFLRAGNNPSDKILAIEHARTVLSIGSDDATALALAGWLMAFLDHDYDTARGAVENALELNPNSANALGVSAILNSFLGRHDEAIEHAKLSIRLNPFDPASYLPWIGLTFAHFCNDRYAESADAARRAIQSNPLFIPAHAMLAACYVGLGQLDEAHKIVQHVLEVEPEIHFRVSLGIVAAGQPADAEKVASALLEVGLPE